MKLSGEVHRFLDKAFRDKVERAAIKAAIAACEVECTDCTVDPGNFKVGDNHLVVLTAAGVVGVGWPMSRVLWQREIVHD